MRIKIITETSSGRPSAANRVIEQYQCADLPARAPRMRRGVDITSTSFERRVNRVIDSGSLEAAVVLTAAIRRARAGLESEGIAVDSLIKRLEGSIRNATFNGESAGWGSLTAAQHANKLTQSAAEIQPVAKAVSDILDKATDHESSVKAVADVERLFGRLEGELSSRPTQVLELLLSCTAHLRNSVSYPHRDRLDAIVRRAYTNAPHVFAKSSQALCMYAEVAVLQGDAKAVASLQVRQDVVNPRLAALITVSKAVDASPAERNMLAGAIAQAFAQNPLEALTGFEAFALAVHAGDTALAQRLARVLSITTRDAVAAGEAQLFERDIESVVSNYLGEQARLGDVDRAAFDPQDGFAAQRVRELAASIRLQPVIIADPTSFKADLDRVAACPWRDGRLHCGNYRYGGIAHDSRFDAPSRAAFAAYLESKDVMATRDAVEFSRQADLIIRGRFSTDLMEDLESPFHKLFDLVYTEMRDRLAPTSLFSATSSIADFLEGFGDCRQHAAVKFEMFHVWRDHHRKAVLGDFATSCLAGETHQLSDDQAELLNHFDAWQMRIVDSHLEPFGAPHACEEHTWTLLEQTVPVRNGERRGPPVKLIAADAFYHKKYPLGSESALELTLMRGEALPESIRISFGERYEPSNLYLVPAAGQSCVLDSGQCCDWATSILPFSGDRPGVFEPRHDEPTLRGAGIGTSIVSLALMQNYRGVVARESRPEQKMRRSASIGNSLRTGNNNVTRDRFDLFLNTMIERFPLEMAYLSQGVDSTPTRDLASSKFTSKNAVLGDPQMRKTLRNIYLAGRVLSDDYAAFTLNQKPPEQGGLKPETFKRVAERLNEYAMAATKALPKDFRSQDVGDVVLDQLATLAMLRDIAKSDTLRAGIRDSLPAEDPRRDQMSTIPEDAMVVALIGNNGVLDPKLIATGLFDKYLDLPAHQRNVLLAAMRLPNIGQLAQPVEALCTAGSRSTCAVRDLGWMLT
ncbi:MAG: hypothetical protein H7Z43_13425 [Clostridia bacterium]|nr:hypothetical protein [Deltaproteobacteria bacterium]